MAQNIIVGAIKIKDGLFIGDEYASQDREFIVNNKVTHIINCSGTEVQNKWIMINVKYLTFNWLEQDNEVKHSIQKVLFDDKNENVNKIYAFIEECFQQGESCLVHSLRGQSRACCVLAAYFMKKYSWTLYKTLEYLNSRRPDLEIRASFFYQLNALESKMNKNGPKRTASWNQLTQDELNPQQLQDELIIRNTFLNSQNGPVDDIYTNLQSKLVQIQNTQQSVLGKVYNQKIKWKDQLNKENIQLSTLVYSGSPDFVQITDTKLKEDIDYQSILKGVQKTTLNQPAKQPQIQHNFPKFPNQNNHICKQLKQDDCESFKQNAQMSNNQSFQNLLMHCAQRQKQNSQQEKKTSPISSDQMQSPQFINQPSGVRSTSLQQNDDKKNQNDLTNNRPSSVKQKDASPSLLTNFQEFKNQVQQSLHYFNKQSETILNMDKHLMNVVQQQQQQQQQSNISNQSQQNDSKLQIQLSPQQQLASQQKTKLDQLISPTLISTMSSTKHSEIQKTLTQSITQLQSSYQKFQQLQMNNQMKLSQSTSQIQQQQQNNSKISAEQSTTNIANISKIQDRSSSLIKKGEDLDSKNRPNSADIKDQQKSNSVQKKESLSPFQKDPIKKMHQYGPPLPQSNSQLYLRNVQCRRQAASTLRNQQKPNNSFQDKYLNQSANQVQNNSSFNNNSNSNIEPDSKMQQKVVQGLASDVNHLKKLISPQSLTKSQAQFLKNQPIRVLQELTEKTQSIKQIKGKDSIQSAAITFVQKPSTVNTRTFSPAIKNDQKCKSSHVGNPQNLRSKIRNSSPGLNKDQESSSSFSYSNVNTTQPEKNSWKML
ncbi:unnamed protein product (macronuclear) [Paramecium tetraurelia]|uniref:Tyrosine-protein phosphatase domain-containing protein n=1 Tax=Paramecium tetraurelia TaxID=5888 RepID=A0EDV7_PARTE|nr:uncharacterized protein GSPATT00025818001 [Paramecium tetraurelia]CAK93474.1 unnamed protein product [Paramecium tetraurelia]|eukprot:XP_001460871.1 hypothetical protein (macronuclear) [Paramecium tetraurelia strain d4-2]